MSRTFTLRALKCTIRVALPVLFITTVCSSAVRALGITGAFATATTVSTQGGQTASFSVGNFSNISWTGTSANMPLFPPSVPGTVYYQTLGVSGGTGSSVSMSDTVFVGTVTGTPGQQCTVTLTCNFYLITISAYAPPGGQIDVTAFSEGLTASDTGSFPTVSPPPHTGSISSLITIGANGQTPVTLHAFPTVLTVASEAVTGSPQAEVGIEIYGMKATVH